LNFRKVTNPSLTGQFDPHRNEWNARNVSVHNIKMLKIQSTSN